MTISFTVSDTALAAIFVTGLICLTTALMNAAICDVVKYAHRRRTQAASDDSQDW